MRVKTGVLGMDTLLGGGFRKNSVNVIVGASGTGKTIFAIQYLLRGIENGEKGIYISFDVDAKTLVTLAESLGWDQLMKAMENGMLAATRCRANNIAFINEDLLEFIDKNAEENTRIVIDSLTPLITPIDFSQRNDLNWFFEQLKASGTTLVTVEERFTGSLSLPEVALPVFLADSAIYLKNLRYGEPFSRTLEIIKHRASWHAEGVYPYRILPGLGIVVECDIEFKPSDKKILEYINGLNVPKDLKEKLKYLAERVEVTERFIEKVVRIYELETE